MNLFASLRARPVRRVRVQPVASEAVLDDLVAERPDVDSPIRHDRRGVLGEVPHAVGRFRVTVKELLHPAVDGRCRVVRNERAGNDLGVRVPQHRVRAPDNARGRIRPVGGNDEAPSRHTGIVSRCHLHALGAEGRDALRSEVVVISLDALVLAPDKQNPAVRPFHVHGSSMDMIALARGCLRGKVALEFDDRPVRIGRRRGR
jgi:hypothetical protein